MYTSRHTLSLHASLPIYPHQLAGAQRVLRAQSDGRQGTDAALAADLLDPGRAAFGRRDQLVAAILFVEENLFGFDGLRLEDLHTAERMRGIRRLVDDALKARHREGVVLENIGGKYDHCNRTCRSQRTEERRGGKDGG